LKNIFSNKVLLFDGAMGTMLQEMGFSGKNSMEILNLTNREAIEKIHKEYILAGSDVIQTNTFGANNIKLKEFGLEGKIEGIITNGVKAAKNAAEGRVKVALSVGPTGVLFEPYGKLDFDTAYEVFKEVVTLGKMAGADMISIETMGNLAEARCAIIAAVETGLPVIGQMTFEKGNKTLFGNDPTVAAVVMESLGCSLVGANCSGGPFQLYDVIKTMDIATNVPLMVQPNAGLPLYIEGKTVFPLSPKDMALMMEEFFKLSIGAIGGCCGSTPEHIKEIKKLLPKDCNSKKRTYQSIAASSTSWVSFGSNSPAVAAGERINPTGKAHITDAIKENNYSEIIKEAKNQIEGGAKIIDVNVSVPSIDEGKVLPLVVKELQQHIEAPLMLDSRNIEAIEKSLKKYNGKAVINSIDGSDKLLDELLPIAKKYGSAVVALCMEKKIPKTAKERLDVAKKIYNRALDIDFNTQDIIFDGLTLTIGADPQSALTTLETLRLLKENFPECSTILGVSNISHGLPIRDNINRDFLSMAINNGLDIAIIDTTSPMVMEGFRISNYLTGRDKEGREFFSKGQFITIKGNINTNIDIEKNISSNVRDLLYKSILDGYKDNALLESQKALMDGADGEDIINNVIIKALEELGQGYEKGKVFLPQLLLGAEAAKSAVEVILEGKDKKQGETTSPIIMATVEGDLHDIGKNIVVMLLSNWGFNVIDLGKDVSPQRIVFEVKAHSSPLVGLSSLMTTTLPAMEKTISQLREEYPACKIMVGGAVLNGEIAKKFGADFYGKDAREAIKIAQQNMKLKGQV
jgi:5-methyltetrahydrofolate--homocysteine methyltransferase